jgi:DNA-directed RNA polymerase II subunit RPB1
MDGVVPVKEASKIIGIQFSILSPNEIIKSSVAEITSRDTFVNNKPVINGLFDPRMGVTEPGLICPTDGLDHMQTPGYHGHIKLARPVYYIQYFNIIMKVLRCVCHNCSKLLINKETYSHLLDLPADERWNQVFKLASAVKTCGEENDDGCGYMQPSKIRKEGIATIVVEWAQPKGVVKPESTEDVPVPPMELIPEVVHKILRRITDDDVTFMGFNPLYSRPDWMICQVLAVPPPAVRPSVKQDAQQRSEDDLSHILVHIFKTNKTLLEKIQQNASANVIKDWHTYLQYHVASLIDNKQPGVDAVAQRSGRPHKSVKERLVGKPGRVRSNLMGKRVDYSARSVITPDPQLSIRELGIPLRIAMNLTKPVKVNDRNIRFLTKLVQNGPDVFPGAKILQRKDGEIVLRHVDRTSLKLKIGDIVHRHMMDGDAVLFNRQPTLHRMSMMCHIARIMPVGDTFRMNVGDTKPYNADFDGDEMNLHMPQDDEAEAELRNLAAVQYQIISPGNNQSIIGIFQDSALGSYLLTRDSVKFNIRDSMNLLSSIKTFDTSLFANVTDKIGSFSLLSQIMPPLTLRYKTKAFDAESEDAATSNAVVEIVDGQYLRGQMTKEVLGSGSKGLIHRLCNDFSNFSSSQFIDDLQNIVTDYMKMTAYSVGISDLIADQATNQKIGETISTKKQDVQNLIDQTHLGVFENKTGRTNEAEFEIQVTNILNNATRDAGNIGLKSLSKNNRFVIMVKAGSKGNETNISQMISCLGQQNVDGKRVPYGFENRTLPHYHKYDDSPGARGFVESSFIGGLTPQELFFHAMGGRMGLIDTAVKTSNTGYIQRRLIKGMEDLKVTYDMTVRNSKGKVVQFAYGDDNMETTKVESQVVPFFTMSVDEILAHFSVAETSVFTRETARRMKSQMSQYNDWLMTTVENNIINTRDLFVEKVFNYRDTKTVNLPVAFQYIINNVIGQLSINQNSLVDITPLEAVEMIESLWEKISNLHYTPPKLMFRALYVYHLSPRELLGVKRFNKKALAYLLDMVRLTYMKAIVAPGEMVGMIAAQSLGEPATQMTLNTFHLAGVATKSNVTRGVQRLEEILQLSREPSNPSCTVFLHADEESDRQKAIEVKQRIAHTRLRQLVSDVKICFDPDELNTLVEGDQDILQQYYYYNQMVDDCAGAADEKSSNLQKSKWVVRMELDAEKMLDHGISMDDIFFAIKSAYGDEVSCTYSDFNSDKLVFRVTRMESASQIKKGTSKVNPLDQADQIYILKGFQDSLLDNLVLRGVKDIRHATILELKNIVEFKNGGYKKKDVWVVDTVGSNLLELMALDYIDKTKVISNDIREVYDVLGIEAARQAIYDELFDTLEYEGTYINYHHLSLLCDRMTYNSTMTSIFRHGINSDDIGPIAKASFEETPEMFLRAARHAELDPMRGVSANVMCGQEGNFGTAAFQLMLDMDKMREVVPTDSWQHIDVTGAIEAGFGELAPTGDACSTQNIVTQTNVKRILPKDTGRVAEDYMPDF